MIQRVANAALLYLCLGALALGLASQGAFAQSKGWSEEFYLARETTTASRVTSPALAAEGDNVYVVYRQGRIMFTRSGDRGKSWTDPVEISGGRPVNGAPAIAKVGSKLLAVWPSLDDIGNGMSAYQLFFSTSTDNGSSWAAPVRYTKTKDDAFSPRFLVQNDVVTLLWMESPIAETLGAISPQARMAISPDSLEYLEAIRGNAQGGALQQSMRAMQAIIYVASFNPASNAFSPRQRVDQLSGQGLPHIFNLFGPYQGKLFIAANENTEVRIYESSDGVDWKQNFNVKPYSSSQMLADLLVVDGQIHSVWIRRDPFARLPVNFQTSPTAREVQLSAPHYVRSVPRVAFSDNVFHVVWEAGESEDSWITYMRTDDIRPTSKFTFPDSPDVTARTMTFQWQGDDNISAPRNMKYSYTFGDKPWTTPQSENQATLRAPADGEYTFKVRAEDAAGNIQEPPAEFAFNTLKSAPTTELTNAPAAGAELNRRDFTLEFSGDDNNDPASQLEYSTKLDGEEWTPFQKGNKHTFANLSNGSHTLSIRTRDSKGNVDPNPPSCNITVKVGLELVLDASPAITSNNESVSFEWTAHDDKGKPVSLNFYYQLDNGTVTELQTESKLELSQLDEGKHNLIVWGRDASGDETPKVESSWTIDRTAPDTTASFTGESQAGFPMLRLLATDPELPDGTGGRVPDKFEYRINGGQWVSFTQQGPSWPAPKMLAFYSWGYVVDVRAIDDAGNVDATPATVDLRLMARNPILFYSVAGVLAIAILFSLYKFMPRGGGRRASTSMASSSAMSDEASSSDTDSLFSSESDDDFGSSSWSFDDDDDEKKKDDDPYA